MNASILRRLALPAAVATLAALATLAPGALGAQGHRGARAGATGATGPTGSSGGTIPPLGVVASVTACHQDPSQANRYAIFESQTRAVPGSTEMAVEFVLQEHNGSAAGFATVGNAPGFGSWVRSQPGVGIFTYSHEVTGLPAPASFRVLVRARWLDRRRRVIRHEAIPSPVCTQTVLVPDLSIGVPLTRTPGPQPGTVVYSIVVRNDGTASAGSFQVALTVGGVAAGAVTVTGLAPSSTQLVQVTGPRCKAGSSVVVQADPAGAVTEPANANRARTFSCPR